MIRRRIKLYEKTTTRRKEHTLGKTLTEESGNLSSTPHAKKNRRKEKKKNPELPAVL